MKKALNCIVFLLIPMFFIITTKSDNRINLNTATKEQIETIRGIGPSFAARIVLERDRRGGFRSINDLLKIRGVGRKTLAKIEPHVVVEVTESHGR